MKKITSLILVLAMLVSVFSFNILSVSAEGEGNTMSLKNQQTVEILKTLGVANTFLATYNESATMTRRQFCIMMKDFLGKSFGATTNLIPFDDVMDYDPDIGVLRTMTELGFMYGFDDNTFRPDEEVAYEDAITVMVNMLGYKLPAESKGGYPMGYLAVAAQEGLLEGVTPVSGKAITHGDILTLLSNFIGIEVLEQVSFGSESKFQAVENETILAKHFNVYKGDGIVNGTNESMLDMSSALTEDKVQIGESILYVNGTNAKAYFGYDVEYYYELNKSGISKLVGIYPSDKNEELIIDVADKGNFEGSELTYSVEGSNKLYKAKIQIGTVTVYNGVAAAFDREKINNMQEGFLKFLDNDGDGRYDVLFVEEIRYFVVKNVDKINGILYGKYSLTSGDDIIKLEEDDFEVKYTITDANGAPYDISKIKEWDVLSVTSATIGTDKVIKIKVASNMVSGKLTTLSGEYGDYDYVTINDTQYKVSNTMNALIVDGDIPDFKLGEEISLVLNALGSAVTVKKDSKFSGKLGILKDYGYLTISNKEFYVEFIDDTATKVLTYLAPKFSFKYADSSVVIDDKIELNDTTEFQQFVDALDTCFNANRAVFRYNLDADGKISEIELATDATTNKSLLEKNRLALVKNTGTAQYRVYQNAFFENSSRMTTGKLYRLAEGAKVFSTPLTGIEDDSLYTVNDNLQPWMKQYDTDSSGYVTYKFLNGQLYTYGEMEREIVAVTYQDAGEQILHYTTPSNAFVVSKVSTVEQDINGEREVLTKLTGINGSGKEDTVLIRDMRSSSDIASKPLTFNFGDILMVRKGSDGFCTFRTNEGVTAMDVKYNSTHFRDNGIPILRIVKATAQGNMSSRFTFTRTESSDMQINSGAVAYLAYPVEISDGQLYLGHYTDASIDGTSTKFDATKSYGIGSEKVFILDSRKKEIRKGTIDEIITVDKKFPVDRYAAHAHDDATVMFTLANINNIQILFVFK